jgi:hypothetical protein
MARAVEGKDGQLRGSCIQNHHPIGVSAVGNPGAMQPSRFSR